MTQIVEPNNPNLERGRYSLVNQEEGADGIFGKDEDAMLEGMYEVIQKYFYSDNMPPIGTQLSYLLLLINQYGYYLQQSK